MISVKYIPLILSGIIVVIGLNVALVIRDSQLYETLQNKKEVLK